MMKFIFKISFFLLFPVVLNAQTQPSQLQRLQEDMKNAANDTVRMNMHDKLGWYYAEINRDSALSYFEMELPVARKLNLKIYEADALNGMGFILYQFGNYPKSLELYLEAQKIARATSTETNTWNLTGNAWNTSKSPNPKDARLDLLGWILSSMGLLYGATGNTSNEISNLLEATSLASSVRDTTLLEVTNENLGDAYLRLGKLDSALMFQQKALFLYTHSAVFRKYEGNVLSSIANIYQKKGDFDRSKDAFLQSVKVNEEQKNLSGLAWSYLSLAKLYQSAPKPDSSMFYAQKALETFNDLKLPSGISDTYRVFSSIFAKQNRPDSAYTYLQLATAIKDSLNNTERTNLLAFKNKDFDELMRLKKLEEEKIQTQTKIRTFALLAGIGVFILITLLLYRNNKQRQKANLLLEQQKQKIEATLSELTSTQRQLIQSEKMASLGELTAGIAHEIQNPLNFVNNFSEINKELIDELKGEKQKPEGVRNTILEDELINDIESNSEKINHHGKRADAIVKGMLQHSRTGTGAKEPTDINKLADEYLRLAYHGLRAKDKDFNATLKTDYDQSLPLINIVPQDIGRVLLNLITNAFYAVGERRKLLAVSYEPLVSVATKKINNKVEIVVSDNGGGIDSAIIDKIFQPFFTTKPTGQGTGLGLSLAYDIVKAHGGEITVESPAAEGTTIRLLLPQ